MYFDHFILHKNDLREFMDNCIFLCKSNHSYIFESCLENLELISLRITSKSCISEYLPTLKCPNYTPKTETFSNKTVWLSIHVYFCINRWLETDAVVIRREIKETHIQLVKTNCLRNDAFLKKLVENEYTILRQDCPQEDWWCKLKTMFVSDFIDYSDYFKIF